MLLRELDLLKLSPSELKNMDRGDIHEGYKKIISIMLMDFYISGSNADPPIETIEDLTEFIEVWVSKNIKSPHPGWNPGDMG